MIKKFKYICFKLFFKCCFYSLYLEFNIFLIDVLNDDNFVFMFECDCFIIVMYMYVFKWVIEGIKKDISVNWMINF